MSGQKFSFTLSIGKDNFSFTNKELGSSSCMKKKSPSQIRRELRRREERSLKKAAEPTEKVAEASESESGPKVNTVDFQCSQCVSSFNAEEDLNAHIGEVHSDPVLPTPEKERAQDQVAELLLTPISGQRKEEDTISSPLHTVHVCDLPKKSGGGAKCIDITYLGREHGMLKCGKSFTNENDLIIHAKKNRNYCLEHDRMWFKCIPCKLRE